MGLVSSRSNNAEAQDLRHNFGGFTGAFHPMVGKLVGWQALGVKRAETGLVSEQLFFFQCYGARRDLHSFPTRRSSDLRPSGACPRGAAASASSRRRRSRLRESGDRTSTRLNSSHLVISYAVFCLKK